MKAEGNKKGGLTSKEKCEIFLTNLVYQSLSFLCYPSYIPRYAAIFFTPAQI